MFQHEALFWGGFAAISLPILIHLLNRRRFRVRDWAAMKFLLDSLRKNRRRLRIEELILLAVRCLAVLMLAAAVGRFTGCSALNVLPGGEGASREIVFVLDDSYSMGQAYGATTLFASAAGDLSEQIRQLPRTDEVAILLASQSSSQGEFFPLNLITDPDSLLARLGTLKPSDRRTDLASALTAASKTFRSENKPRWLYVLSDFRRHDLQGAEHTEALRKRMADLREEGVRVVALDYGLPASDNCTVQAIELLDRFVVAGTPARLALSVRNNSPRRAGNVEVNLSVRAKAGGRFRDVQPPAILIDSIDPDEVRRVEFSVACEEAGSAVVTARLPSDELAGDNAGYLALDVRPAVRVLLVDGRADAADPLDTESFFLAAALDPHGDASSGCKLDRVSANSLPSVRFDDYDLVCLLNVSDFPLRGVNSDGRDAYPQLTSLQEYVQAGGGLILFTGDRVNLEFYNRRLYDEGAGLAPFPIGPPKGSARQDKYFRLDPRSVQADSIMRSFQGEAVIAATLIRFFAFSPADEIAPARTTTQARPPRVLARFADDKNSPAVVHRQFGRGNVLAVYTTASAEWNDWPQLPTEVATFPPVMHDAVAAIARAQQQLQTAQVGEPIHFDLPARQAEARVLVRTPLYPAADAVALPVNPDNGRRSVHFAGADHAGVYSLQMSVPDTSTEEVLLARNVDGEEGQLEPGGRDELTAALGSGEFAYEKRTGGAQLAEIRSGSDKEYWIWAVAALLTLLAVETFLGQRFGHYSN